LLIIYYYSYSFEWITFKLDPLARVDPKEEPVVMLFAEWAPELCLLEDLCFYRLLDDEL
jgi:hypothetical protein